MALKCPSIFGSYSSKQETFDISQKDNSIKNIQLQHLILKTATMCARKFEHMDREKDKSVFSAYCIRKAHKLLQTKSLPNKNETVRIEAELDLFEKYFSNEKIETRNLSQPYNDGSYPSPQFNEIESPPSVGLNGIKEEYQIPQFDVGNDCITDESIIPQFDGGNDSIRDEYIIPQFDGGNDPIGDEYLIPQLDGNCTDDDDVPQKDVYAINSEVEDLSCLMNQIFYVVQNTPSTPTHKRFVSR